MERKVRFRNIKKEGSPVGTEKIRVSAMGVTYSD